MDNTTDKDQIIARLLEERDAWRTACWGWEWAHRLLDYWMTYNPVMGSLEEMDYEAHMRHFLPRWEALVERDDYTPLPPQTIPVG